MVKVHEMCHSHRHRHRNINRRMPYLYYCLAPNSFQRRIAAARLAKSILLYHHNNEKNKNNSTLSRSSIHQQPPFQLEGDNGDKTDNGEALIEVGVNHDDPKDTPHRYPLRNLLRSSLPNPNSKPKYTTTRPHRHNRKQRPSNPKPPAPAAAPAPAGNDSLHANQQSTSNDFHPIPEPAANISFDDIGGLSNFIDSLREVVFFPLLYPEYFTHAVKSSPPKGVLFCGPPGTGKTLLARALASIVSPNGRKITFYMQTVSDIASKWVGEAERRLKVLFEEAKKNEPSIIFFDEIDGLAPARSNKQEQIHNSIVATILALMDGLGSRGQVVVIGATNRVDDIDAALRRPGRFDREFNFQLPNCDARADILRIHTRDWAHPPSQHLQLELAATCVGYSGADLKALCAEAGLVAFRKNFPQAYLTNEKVLIDVSCVKVERHHFLEAMSKMKPASHRSMTLNFRPLSPVVAPCLQHQLQTVMDAISSILPLMNVQPNRSTILSFSRTRLLLIGDNSMGMNHIVPAILHKLEKFPVHTIFPHLLRSSNFGAKTPEEALECVFREASRSKPSVLYLPNFNIWLDSGHDHPMNHLCHLLDTSPADDPILVLGTSPISLDEISNNPCSLFYRNDKLDLMFPSAEDRSAFFDTIVEQVLKGVGGYVENSRPEAMVPMEEGKRVITESEEYAICQLKKELLNVCNEIVSDKRFKAFINFKDESGRFDNRVGLVALAEEIKSGRKCKTLKSFLEDVNLVVAKAKKFYKDDAGIAIQGCLLVLEVKNLVAKIDKSMVEMTDKIAEEIKQRVIDGEMSIRGLKKLLVERTDDYGIDKLERLHPKILNHVHSAIAIFADAHNNKDDEEEDVIMTRHNIILKCMFEFALDEANFNH